MSVANEYRDLLVEFVPGPIRSDRDYRRALAQLEKLMVPRPSAARSRLIELVSTLVEDYEARKHPTPELPPARLLAHLLEARGVKCSELARHTGISAATLSNVLADRRGISKSAAGKLARFFEVSPIGFLNCAAPLQAGRLTVKAKTTRR